MASKVPAIVKLMGDLQFTLSELNPDLAHFIIGPASAIKLNTEVLLQHCPEGILTREQKSETLKRIEEISDAIATWDRGIIEVSGGKYPSGLYDLKTKEDIMRVKNAVGDVTVQFIERLREPVVYLKGIFSILYRNRQRLDYDSRRFLNWAKDSNNLVREFTEGMDSYKKAFESKGQCNVREIVDSIVKMTKYIRTRKTSAGKRVKIGMTTRVSPNVPETMQIPESQLKVLLSNTVTNAVHAIEGIGGKGTIHLSAKPVNGSSVKFSIIDNGPGMTKEQLQMFDRWGGSSKPGKRVLGGGAAGRSTGLGGPLSQTIVRTLGGRRLVRSVPKKGTAISFVLPIKPKIRRTRVI